MQSHQHFLQIALDQARLGLGQCAPNPAVGAVIVRDGQVIGKGYHAGPGLPHAEVMALHDCADADGATLYVTLEPCCHHGRTPPCTDAIKAAGVARVFFAVKDPNRHTAEFGQAVLQQAGIVCEHVPVADIDAFYQYYLHWLQTGKAWLTAKLALSFDGKIAGPGGKPVKISGDKLNDFTHQQRQQADAIMTTVNTIIADDPSLNVRLDGKVKQKPLLVIDREARLPLDAKVFTCAASITVFHGADADPARLQALRDKGVQCQMLTETEQGLDLPAIKMACGKLGFHHIWLEAGGTLMQSALLAKQLDRCILYISPRILGKVATPAFTQPLDFVQLCPQYFLYID